MRPRSSRVSTTSPPSASSSSSAPSLSASSASSLSTTLMPISLSIAFMSSIWSEEISSDGRTAFNSSCVTQPRFLATLSIRLTAASVRSRSGLSTVSTAAVSPSFASSFFAITPSPSLPRPLTRDTSCRLTAPKRGLTHQRVRDAQLRQETDADGPTLLSSQAVINPRLNRGRSPAGKLAETVDRRLGMRKVGEMGLNVQQSGEILLVWLGRQRPFRKFQFPI